MKYILFISLFFLSLSLYSWDNEILLSTSELYSDSGENPLLLEEGPQWTSLGLGDLSSPKRLAGFQEEAYRYRLRFRVSLREPFETEMTTLQLRFAAPDDVSLYHIPLEGLSRTENTLFSNWYYPSESFPLDDWRGAVSLRILSPPGRDVLLNIFKVEIELWGEPLHEAKDPQEPVLASSGPVLEWVNKDIENPLNNKSNEYLSLNEARDFALDFVDILIKGDLPAFYSSLNENVYSLNTGNSYSRYRISPPEGLLEHPDYRLEDYIKGYDFKLYSYQQFIELFPQWSDADRNWNPGVNTWLFLGNRPLTTLQPLGDDELLVFMMEKRNGKVRIVARPEF